MTAPARADGDPASDVLLYQRIFFPYNPPSSGDARALQQQVAAIYGKRNRIKVAVIASREDLGAIPSLFGHHREYARFLGQELRLNYIGPLLIIMPSGYGIYDGGRNTTAEQAVLAGLPAPGDTSAELTQAAARAVGYMQRAGALHSEDIRAPYASVISATYDGTAVRARYYVYDDSEWATTTLTLAKKGHVLAQRSIPEHRTPLRQTESWTIRLHAPDEGSTLRFCVHAVDPTGNRSASACAYVHR